MDSIIDDLFADTNVISTHDVAVAFDLTEADARALADDLRVAKIGASYAWAQADVEALSAELDAVSDDDDEEEDETDD